MKQRRLIITSLFLIIVTLSVWGCSDKTAIREEIKRDEKRIEAIQIEINAIIIWKNEQLGRASILKGRGRMREIMYAEEVSKINAQADPKLERLRHERDFLIKKVIVLMEKL